jgi:RNA polymerase sigma-70 factor (ECF subfamily)
MPAELDPDAALMLRVKQGDAAAFTQLVEKYKQPIMNLVWRTVRDETEAEDITQSVFVQAWKSAPRYQATAKFSTWLYTIARNLCLNEFRRRSRHPAESLDQMRDDSADQPLFQVEDKRIRGAQDEMLQGELELKVDAAIGALPENQRIALALCRQEELSYEEIAEVLGCSLSATKSLIHRARETLKAQLKPYLQSGVWEEKELNPTPNFKPLICAYRH